MKRKPRILITAGPTREHIDPVRYISNLSSGRLGYALAQCAQRREYEVVLISGPTMLRPPRNIHVVQIVSAADLEKEVKKYFKRSDVLFMSAAVSDYSVKKYHKKKIKRKGILTLRCEATNDILAGISLKKKDNQFVCGFCLETNKYEENARKKLQEKKLDMIVAHEYGHRQNPFGDNRMNPLIIFRDGSSEKIRNISKQKLASYLLNTVMEKINGKRYC